MSQRKDTCQRLKKSDLLYSMRITIRLGSTGIQWNANDTITYKQIRTWHYAPELSVADLDTEITIINPIAASIGEMLRTKIPKALHLGTDWLLRAKREQVFVTQKVGDILFNGFDDPFLTFMEDFKMIIEPFVPVR